MRARDRHELHRVATPLELFSDLAFVVAIAQAASAMHHALSEGHVGAGVLGFLFTFFAIWWAWMNFTWFGSAYDVDDVPYRIAVLVQIAGVLVLAAGVPRAAADGDFTVTTLGYAIMRIALVVQWLRAAGSDVQRRVTALRYAGAIFVLQIGWLLLLALSVWQWRIGFLILGIGELAVPAWAERDQPTTWHPHHIVERYALMTIIVLGESMLAGTLAIQSSLDEHGLGLSLASLIVGAPLIVFAMWWLYFDHAPADRLTSNAVAMRWGYGHYLIFASAAATGGAIAVGVDAATEHAHLSPWVAGACLAVPVSIYLAATATVHAGLAHLSASARLGYLLATLAVLASSVSPMPGLTIGLILVALAGFTAWRQSLERASSALPRRG